MPGADRHGKGHGSRVRWALTHGPLDAPSAPRSGPQGPVRPGEPVAIGPLVSRLAECEFVTEWQLQELGG